MNQFALQEIQNKVSGLFSRMAELDSEIRKALGEYSNGKTLKGSEYVGWLGEIYVKYYYDGVLVDDTHEHDVQTATMKISVKTRKGWKSGWRHSSAIPKIRGTASPTHLAFVHLDENFKLDGIWLFEWQELIREKRFEKHMVRKKMRSWIFRLNEKKDALKKVYPFI